LANPTLKQAMNANWYGLNGMDGKAPDFFKFLKNPILNGLLDGKKDLHGVPYSITEEFTSVYRLHSLLPEQIEVRSNESGQTLEQIPLETTRDSDAHNVTDRYGSTDLLFSFGTQHPGALVLNNFPAFMQKLKMPLFPEIIGEIDMGTIDIVRDRERGVPRYNEFRRLINLKPIRTFADLTSDPVQLEKLGRLYRGDVEKLDLVVGCLAEAHRPDGFGFGETQFQIFILMASRRLQADRFFTTDFTPQMYTQEGMDWIKEATFKSVLLRHFPGLEKHLEGVTNAFNPWNG
jgi:hypothetical protein